MASVRTRIAALICVKVMDQYFSSSWIGFQEATGVGGRRGRCTSGTARDRGMGVMVLGSNLMEEEGRQGCRRRREETIDDDDEDEADDNEVKPRLCLLLLCRDD